MHNHDRDAQRGDVSYLLLQRLRREHICAALARCCGGIELYGSRL